MTDLDAQITARLEELGRLAEQHASAKSEVVYLEEFKKSKLAILMKKAERAGVNTGVAQEREARADPEYLQLLDGLKVAVEIAESARWKLEVAKMAIEVWRTRRADVRAEMQLT